MGQGYGLTREAGFDPPRKPIPNIAKGEKQKMKRYYWCVQCGRPVSTQGRCVDCESKRPKPTRGGKRAGAGAKAKPEGKRTVSRSINLTRAQWARLDELRGTMSRSKWIAAWIDSA